VSHHRGRRTPTARRAVPIADRDAHVFFAPYTGAGSYARPRPTGTSSTTARASPETAAMIDA